MAYDKRSRGIKSFNGEGNVVPSNNDYSFDMLNPSGSTLNLFSDVDTVTTPPSEGQVLKFNGTKWVHKII